MLRTLVRKSKYRVRVAALDRNFCDTINVFFQLKKLIGDDNVIQGEDKFRIDWLKSYTGGSLVCFPKTTADVSNIMKYCSANLISVVAQGGNTGLVGGAVPIDDKELIISLAKMNKIIEIDEVASVVVCEAGCVLQNIEFAVQPSGFVLPLDLASKGSCMIGGNVSTNAGGIRRLKYGSLHENVLGILVVYVYIYFMFAILSLCYTLILI